MFSRSVSNPMEESVTKATDENLTSENWEYILSVCDKVDHDPENGAHNAINAIQKRLGHRNANVQLFSLSLAEALSKNCGSKVHREIASRSFTQALMRLINDRTIHTKVKARTGELIKHWSDEFRRDPSLGIMMETYNTLKAQGVSIEGPSRPQKEEISDADRRREEEELQIALAMSLSDSNNSSNGRSQPSQSQSNAPARRTEVDNGPNAYTLPAASSDGAYTLPSQSSQRIQAQPEAQPQQTPIAARTAATVSRCRALYDFVASEAGELSFRRGDIISVIESAYKDWWRGSLHGNIGIFPTNYVENLPDPTPADLRREAEEETRVFAEAKNVEKLLSILSAAEFNDPGLAENEQLQNLYHSTLSMRPKLVRLIEKYSQKKDDLIMLNEKFMKARKDYDGLMEASLARYNTSLPYNGRPSYDPRVPNQAHAQRPMNSGGYAPDSQQRQPNPRLQYATEPRQYSGDQRQQQQYAIDDRRAQHSGARQQRVNSIPEQFQHQSPAQGTSPGVFQQPPSQAAPQQWAQHSGPVDPYRTNQPARTNFHAEPYQNQMPRQNTNDSSGFQQPYVPHMSPSAGGVPTGPSMPGSFPNAPTSPSQELVNAFPSAPPDFQSTASYDHARAEREGGPPIAYFNAGAPDGSPAPHSAAQVNPDPRHGGARPSSPDDYEEGDAIDPADYYRRTNHNFDR